MEKIKLVIWDLDDTFWQGTLSEENIHIPEEHIRIVKELTDRGIINSICSKNDHDKVQSVLKANKLDKYFVFSRITWEPKGELLKSMIDSMQLRAGNVLFIDDNHLNLKEAKFYNKDIHVEGPAFISKMLNHKAFEGKKDSTNARLNQYKLLEKRQNASKKHSSNEEFLRQSNICMIYHDVNDNLERLEELSLRSNQINYTKRRFGKKDILYHLRSSEYDVRCFQLKDKFGDYGIVGYFILDKKKHELIEFVFSCRIMNLGLPSFVYYNILKNPKLKVEGETSEGYDKNVNWIRIIKKPKKIVKKKRKKGKTLLIGGCDLDQVYFYLKGKHKIDTMFNYVNNFGTVIHSEHSHYLLHGKTLKKKYANAGLFKNIPFLDEKMFTTIENMKRYDLIIYSVLMDYTHAGYECKTDRSLKVYCGDFNQDLTKKSNWSVTKYDKKFLKWFSENFKFKGRITDTQFEKNIRSIIEKTNREIIFINGAEYKSNKLTDKGRELSHKKMNKILSRVVSQYDYAHVCDINKIIKSSDDLSDSIRHYKREIYFELSKMLASKMSKIYSVRQDVTTLGRHMRKFAFAKRYLLKTIITIKKWQTKKR